MQYFKDKTSSTGVLFPQETHSDSKVDHKWKEDIKCPAFFSRKVYFLWRHISLLWNRNVYH